MMSPVTQSMAILFASVLFTLCGRSSEARLTVEKGLKTMVYLSPKITQHPGSSSNKTYYDIDFPKGHIAIKSFNAEIVDETGNPVSLEETYMHHWFIARYYQHKDIKLISGNAGLCDHGHPQFFGLGSETRKTSTHVPDPYGVEVGNPVQVPAGFEEKWLFNIHAIDTRGTLDPMGCIECRCTLYNVTKNEHGLPLDPNYKGGFHCCYDGTQCEMKKGLKSVKRNVYLRYTVKWVDWSESVVPVQIYVLDVTDPWQSTGTHMCTLEYDIDKSVTGVGTNELTSTKRSNISFPTAGDVVYAVAHLHTGGTGSNLYGEDGRVICVSKPIYGQGNSVGDEAGYIVGMTTCYPKPGSVKIGKNEILTLESSYSSEKSHTGVLGLFYILVAESSFKP
ncbi:uncharacterized protein [Rutidosis leptorrhynchoides]|uniref:uncharacterized protein n=1 Tax=Rutidosis leptorrhynchoides TaxID=125765 RepID=UPI003A995575